MWLLILDSDFIFIILKILSIFQVSGKTRNLMQNYFLVLGIFLKKICVNT